MDASMWVAKTGLDAQQMRMNVISNNLANVIALFLRICFIKTCVKLVAKQAQQRKRLRA